MRGPIEEASAVQTHRLYSVELTSNRGPNRPSWEQIFIDDTGDNLLLSCTPLPLPFASTSLVLCLGACHLYTVIVTPVLNVRILKGPG
jgi:hypothetical protein